MAQRNNDVDFRMIALHELPVEAGSPPIVGEVSRALGRVKSAVATFTEEEVKVRENVNLNARGKQDAIRRRAEEALRVVESAEGVLARAETDVETRRRSITPTAMMEPELARTIA